jgi:RNA polymerase sigma-70 factor (ECF subfamily)
VNPIEKQLAEQANKGDSDAFVQLVDLYKDKIFHLGFRMLGNSHEAEDIVQETFLRVYTNLHRYDDSHKFSTWIYRIGTNICIDRLRKRKGTYSLDAETHDGEGVEGYALLASQENTPENQLLVSEAQKHIREVIDKLPEKYKSVIVLRYMHDLSLQEISDVLQMPVTTIKTRVHRGREYLRQKMDREKYL